MSKYAYWQNNTHVKTDKLTLHLNGKQIDELKLQMSCGQWFDAQKLAASPEYSKAVAVLGDIVVYQIRDDKKLISE